jgi:GNAT superfamily N-acetyltransferase
MTYKIQPISPEIAETLCRQITTDLPEYFGLPDANEHYALGVQSRVNFAASVGSMHIGLLSLEFPYPNNSSIYWMSVLRAYQGTGVGHLLIQEAVLYAKKHAAKTMIVETLAPDESDENYLKTYNFYKKSGFSPLMNLKPEGYERNMVYMVMDLDQFQHKSNNLSIKIRTFAEQDIPLIVENFAKHNWLKPASTFEGYNDEQNHQERQVWLAFYENEFAGYITVKWNSFYPSFKEQAIPEIMDLIVLPPYRNKGIGSALMDIAEMEVRKNKDIVGIGFGLYDGYGNAQKLYIARGYVPDGLGITYNYARVEYGNMVPLDDDLVLWFSKKLK